MTHDLELFVGQVIYLLAKKDARVYPVLVTEQINKKTLDGNSTSYVVRLPTEDAKEVNLENVNSEIFISLDNARETMVARASRQIDKILEKASEVAAIFPSTQDSHSEKLEQSNSQDDKSIEDFAFVDLGNGQKARLNMKDLNKVQGAER
tara:strand:- start:438 stop:887 length:450 start_codon:yes stop_codon:yes gene_type:complete